jgi:hypothetical protein
MPPIPGSDFFLPEQTAIGKVKPGGDGYADITSPWLKFFRQVAKIVKALNGTGRKNGVVTTDHNGEVQVILNELDSIPFDSGHFTATGGTWDVEAGDVVTWAWNRLGRMVTVTFAFEETTVGGTPTELRMLLPEQFIAQKTMYGRCAVLDNDVPAGAEMRVESNGDQLIVTRLDGTPFSNSTNLTAVRGTFTFEVQF